MSILRMTESDLRRCLILALAEILERTYPDMAREIHRGRILSLEEQADMAAVAAGVGDELRDLARRGR